MTTPDPQDDTVDEYGPQPGQNDLGAFRLPDAPNPDAKPHRITSVGDMHSGQSECQDCGWHTPPGDRRYHEKADRHYGATGPQAGG